MNTESQQQQAWEQQNWTAKAEGGRLYFGTGYWDIGEVNARTLETTINTALTAEREISKEWFDKWGETKGECQRFERLIEATHEVYKEQLARLEENYTRDLNAKLDQINKQAETIRDERQRTEGEQVSIEEQIAREEGRKEFPHLWLSIDGVFEKKFTKACIAAMTRAVAVEREIVAKEQHAAICCPICAHITSYPAGAEVIKCGHCLRSFQLEPNQERKPECR